MHTYVVHVIHMQCTHLQFVILHHFNKDILISYIVFRVSIDNHDSWRMVGECGPLDHHNPN